MTEDLIGGKSKMSAPSMTEKNRNSRKSKKSKNSVMPLNNNMLMVPSTINEDQLDMIDTDVLHKINEKKYSKKNKVAPLLKVEEEEELL